MRRISVLAAALTALCYSSVTHAQLDWYSIYRPIFLPKYWNSHHEKGLKAAKNLDWETALVELESGFCDLDKKDTSLASRMSCLSNVESDSVRMYSIFFNRLRYELALVYSQVSMRRAMEGRLREADSLGELSLFFLNHIWGDIGASLASVYSSVGSIKHDLHQFEDAEKLHKRALELVERESPPYSAMRALCGIGLGKTYMARKKLYEAEPVFMNAIEAADSNCAAKGIGQQFSCGMSAIGRGYLGEVYRLIDKKHEAESLFHSCLVMLESADPPMQLPQLDSLLDRYSVMLRNEGREQEAGAIDRRAWDVIERRMQEDGDE
jgi:tetratricopeptide (TPR) repeat protein